MIKKFKVEASIPIICSFDYDDMMEEIIKSKKIELFSKAEEIIGEKPFFGKFTITEPPEFIVQDLTNRIERADGMYVLGGEFCTIEEIKKRIRETVKIIELEIFDGDDIKEVLKSDWPEIEIRISNGFKTSDK